MYKGVRVCCANFIGFLKTWGGEAGVQANHLNPPLDLPLQMLHDAAALFAKIKAINTS